jgi:uncharacterized protein (TIGR00255 family)
MTRSMTAFARRETQTELGTLSWEIRALNHRYLEFSPHLPEELRVTEPEVRARVGEKLGRGKVDASLRFKAARGAPGAAPGLNRAYAEQLLSLHRDLSALAGEEQSPPDITELLRWPGVVQEAEPDLEPLQARALALLDETLEELVAGRTREGERLAAAIVMRLDRLVSELDAVRAILPELRQAFQDKLRARLEAVAGELDAGRLEQEMAIFAQKMDVDEELDRTRTHVEEIRRVLELDEPIGRRLDFLMQELNREANTLGSKSVDPRLSRAAVELKVLIEQMREQVQNLE